MYYTMSLYVIMSYKEVYMEAIISLGLSVIGFIVGAYVIYSLVLLLGAVVLVIIGLFN